MHVAYSAIFSAFYKKGNHHAGSASERNGSPNSWISKDCRSNIMTTWSEEYELMMIQIVFLEYLRKSRPNKMLLVASLGA